MGKKTPATDARRAIFAIAEVKDAVDSFDRGETNVFDAIDAIAVAIEGYRVVSKSLRDAA